MKYMFHYGYNNRRDVLISRLRCLLYLAHSRDALHLAMDGWYGVHEHRLEYDAVRAPGEVGNLGEFVQESVCGEDEESNTSSHQHECDSDEY